MSRPLVPLLVIGGVALLLVWWMLRRPKKENKTSGEKQPTAEQALQELLAGNQRSAADQHTCSQQGTNQRLASYPVQRPIAAVLSCSDSRTTPEYIFDQGIGSLFVVRVAGNILDEVVLGSIQYALAVLEVPLVVVLGHERCGAVEAALKESKTGQPAPPHLAAITRRIAVPSPGPDQLSEAIQLNVRRVCAQLRSDRVVGPLLGQEQALVVGMDYDLRTGKVAVIDR